MTGNKKRIVSWIILIAFSFVILSSAHFIVLHSGHHCTSESCSVCTELAECHKTLNTLGTALMGGVHLAVMMFTVSMIVMVLIRAGYSHTTLISLKVELLN